MFWLFFRTLIRPTCREGRRHWTLNSSIYYVGDLKCIEDPRVFDLRLLQHRIHTFPPHIIPFSRPNRVPTGVTAVRIKVRIWFFSSLTIAVLRHDTWHGRGLFLIFFFILIPSLSLGHQSMRSFCVLYISTLHPNVLFTCEPIKPFVLFTRITQYYVLYSYWNRSALFNSFFVIVTVEISVRK